MVRTKIEVNISVLGLNKKTMHMTVGSSTNTVDVLQKVCEKFHLKESMTKYQLLVVAKNDTDSQGRVLDDSDHPGQISRQSKNPLQFVLHIRQTSSSLIRVHYQLQGGVQGSTNLIVNPSMNAKEMLDLAVSKVGSASASDYCLVLVTPKGDFQVLSDDYPSSMRLDSSHFELRRKEMSSVQSPTSPPSEQVVSYKTFTIEFVRSTSEVDLGISFTKVEIHDSNQFPGLFVTAVQEGGLVSGSVWPGDELVEVNGILCRSMQQSMAIQMLEQGVGKLKIVVARESGSLQSTSDQTKSKLWQVIPPESADFEGFSIEAKPDESTSSDYLTVSEVYKISLTGDSREISISDWSLSADSDQLPSRSDSITKRTDAALEYTISLTGDTNDGSLSSSSDQPPSESDSIMKQADQQHTASEAHTIHVSLTGDTNEGSPSASSDQPPSGSDMITKQTDQKDTSLDYTISLTEDASGDQPPTDLIAKQTDAALEYTISLTGDTNERSSDQLPSGSDTITKQADQELTALEHTISLTGDAIDGNLSTSGDQPPSGSDSITKQADQEHTASAQHEADREQCPTCLRPYSSKEDASHSDIRQHKSDLLTALVTLEAQVTDKQQKLASMENQNKIISSKLVAAKKAVEMRDRLEQEALQSKTELEQKEEKGKEMEGKLEKLKMDNTRLASEIALIREELKSSKRSSEEMITGLKEECKQLRSQLEVAKEVSEKTILSSQEEYQHLTIQLSSAKSLAEMKESQLRVELKQVSDRLEKAESDSQKTNEELGLFKQQAESKTLEVETLTIGLKGSQMQLEAKQQMTIRLQGEVDNLRHTNSDLRIEILLLKESLWKLEEEQKLKESVDGPMYEIKNTSSVSKVDSPTVHGEEGVQLKDDTGIEVTKLQDEIRQLTLRLDIATGSYSEREEILKGQVFELERNKDQLEKQLRQNESNYNILKKEMEVYKATENEIAKLNKKVTVLSDALDKKLSGLEAVRYSEPMMVEKKTQTDAMVESDTQTEAIGVEATVENEGQSAVSTAMRELQQKLEEKKDQLVSWIREFKVLKQFTTEVGKNNSPKLLRQVRNKIAGNFRNSFEVPQKIED